MARHEKEKGERLPDLLVVLAVTVVIAAIMLPAVTGSHGNAVNAEASPHGDRIVLDGPVPDAEEAPTTLRDRKSMEADAPDEALANAALVETAPWTESSAAQESDLKKMRTTDISYTIP